MKWTTRKKMFHIIDFVVMAFLVLAVAGIFILLFFYLVGA